MEAVSLDYFRRLDLRVGKVLEANRIPGRMRILRLLLDVGGKAVQTIAGGGDHYDPEWFLGRSVVVLLNMEPKDIGGLKSEAMILAADVMGKPVWLTACDDVPAGSRVL